MIIVCQSNELHWSKDGNLQNNVTPKDDSHFYLVPETHNATIVTM